MAYANTVLVPVKRGRTITAIVAMIDNLISKLPDENLVLAGRAGLSSRLIRRFKHLLSQSKWLGSDHWKCPDAFMLEIYNAGEDPVNVSLSMYNAEGPLRHQPYQELLCARPGFNRMRLPFTAITPHIDIDRKFRITIEPALIDPSDEGQTLYFGLLSFVAEFPRTAPSASQLPYRVGILPEGKKHVKVLAWDLDNTLWDGILVEDGENSLQLKPGIQDIIQELDRRGIVNSIVSKNDAAATIPVLRRFGLYEYFVFPRISWAPKSHSITELIDLFNVGSDTIAEIDDSPFERAEIAERCPGVRVYPHDQYSVILELPEFRPPLSEESSRRREFYLTEEKRRNQKATCQGDYLSFLRDCRILVHVSRTSAGNIDRAHELIQRTNQLNFSGNRYSREMVETLVADPKVLSLNIYCNDRFGDYGLVGLCIINLGSLTITDLMFSCRVQAKRVEHAFLCRLMQAMKKNGIEEMWANYKQTTKNAQSAQVFYDIPFTLVKVDESRTHHLFHFDLGGELPQQDVITVEWEVEGWTG